MIRNYMGRKIFCLIPARSGSKRIKKKNIKDFCGLPIIAWSIKAAYKSKLFDRIIVSTDDDEIAKIARFHGAEVPFRRPTNISCDKSTTLDVIKHFISFINEPYVSNPIIFCLYATTPFITEKEMNLGLKKYLETNESRILFLAKEYNHPIERSFFINKEGSSVLNDPKSGNIRTQDLIPKFHDSGQYYIGSKICWESISTIIDGNLPFIIDNFISHDIDFEKDWEFAEKLFKAINL